jgi:hypothetical protein
MPRQRLPEDPPFLRNCMKEAPMRTAFAASVSTLVTLAGLALGQDPAKAPVDASSPSKVTLPAAKSVEETKATFTSGSSVIPSSCATGKCNDGEPCGPDGCMWGNVEYLLWWTRP